MTTLFDVALPVAEIVHLPHRGAATVVGTATTLIDTVRATQNGYFNGGTIFIISGASAGKFSRISGYNQGIFTFDTVTTLNGVGDRYAAVLAEISLYDIISAINLALLDVGNLVKEDIQLTVVADQEEYTLPTGVSNLCRVETTQSTTTPYEYKESKHWDEIGGTLRFDTGYRPGAAGTKLRLTYLVPHVTVNVAADVIDSQISKASLVHFAVAKVYEEQYKASKDKKYEAMINKEFQLGQAFMNSADVPVVVHASPW
jgi:hypothetical protein